MGLCNISRTLSSGEVGPGSKFTSRGFSLFQLSRGDIACLSEASLCSLASALGAIAQAIRCWVGVALSIRQLVDTFGAMLTLVKNDRNSSQLPQIGPRGEMEGRYVRRLCGIATMPFDYVANSPHLACELTVATLALFFCAPQTSMENLRSANLHTPLAACLLTPRSSNWPFASPFERIEALR